MPADLMRAVDLLNVTRLTGQRAILMATESGLSRAGIASELGISQPELVALAKRWELPLPPQPRKGKTT